VPAVLVRRNATIDGKPLSEMSKRELQDATQAARASAAKPLTPAVRARQKAEKILDKKVKAILKKAGITRTTVQVKKDVVLVSIPRAWIEKLAQE